MSWRLQKPLALVGLLYLGGICFADSLPLPLVPLLGITLSLAVVALAWGRLRPLLLVAVIFLAGAVNLTQQTAIISPHDLRTLLRDQTVLAAMRGRLVATPVARFYDTDAALTGRMLARVEVTAIRLPDQDWQPARGVMAVSTAGTLPDDYYSGQPVEIFGVLRQPPPPVAAGLFDYRTYLRRQGIYYQLQARPNDWQRPMPAGPPPLTDRFQTWARQTLGLGLPADDEAVSLLWAMTLGWKTGLTNEIAMPFMESGTMHIFAISGLHVALIAGILVALLRVLRVPREYGGPLVIVLIWFYTAVTGWQPSAIRSTVMMSIVIAGWTLKRPSDLLNSLAAAALIILVWEPQQLFQASFQLSFSVVLSLALFAPVLDKLRRRWLASDPLLPDQLRPRWQRLLRPVGFWLTAALTTSLAAWLGSIPLVAWYFHLFTPVSLLSNLAIVPLAGLTLTGNLASLLVGGWWPALAEVFNSSSWLSMKLMLLVSSWAAEIPGGHWRVATPSYLTLILYYATLLAVMTGLWRRPRIRGWVFAGIGLLGAACLTLWLTDRAALKLTILPLNGGSGIYFDAPGTRDDWLLDGGNESAARFVTIPFLQAQGVDRLPQLVVSHGDVKSMGGAELLVREFAVPRVVTSSVPYRSAGYRRLVQSLAADPQRRVQKNAGDALGPSVNWQVLYPAATDAFSRADDGALVLAGNLAGTQVLLLSDLGTAGQRAFLERHPALRADIVVTGLPEAGEPLSESLLDALQPRVVVVTDSEFPATRRAGDALQERLARRRIPILYTRTTGSVTLTLRSGGWSLRAMDGTTLSGKPTTFTEPFKRKS